MAFLKTSNFLPGLPPPLLTASLIAAVGFALGDLSLLCSADLLCLTLRATRARFSDSLDESLTYSCFVLFGFTLHSLFFLLPFSLLLSLYLNFASLIERATHAASASADLSEPPRVI